MNPACAFSTALKLFLAWLLAALLLCIGLVYHLDQQQAVQRLAFISWNGAQLSLASGVGQPVGESLSIQALSNKGDAFAFVQLGGLSASEYDLATVEISGLTGNSDVRILWGRMGDSTQTYTALLHRVKGNHYRVQLASESHWRGKISGLGILISSEVFSSLLIHSVQLKSKLYSPVELLEKIGHGLTLFQPWSQKSINFQAAVKGTVLIELVPLAALWASLTMLLYGVLNRFLPGNRQSSLLPALAMIGLIAWLLMDMRWQWHTLQQLGETRQQFAGKSERERLLSADDGPLFVFIDSLKEQLAPLDRVRILVLSDGNPYAEQRSVYHLLPHHVSLINLTQLGTVFRPGDYLLVLNPSVRGQQALNQLAATDSRYESVQLLHTHSLGRLFYFAT